MIRTSAHRSRTLARSLVLAGCLTALGCRPHTDATVAADAGTANAPGAPNVPGAPPAASGTANPGVADLHAPPMAPPADALALPHGGHWRIVNPGVGASPGPDDRLRAKLSVWRHDGTLAYTSVGRGDGSMPFAMGRVPHDLAPSFAQLPPGAVAQFWLPREFVDAAAAEGRKPAFIPMEDVVLEYELVTFDAAPPLPPPAANTAPGSSALSQQPAPDAAGPPPEAMSAGGGVRYLVIARGTGSTAAAPDVRVQMSVAVWQVDGLLVDGPTRREIATTPARAPANLSRLLLGAREGDAFRVWLPLARAKEAFPGLAQHDSVCDLNVDAVGEAH